MTRAGSGSSLIRTPEAAKSAFATAGATGGAHGSMLTSVYAQVPSEQKPSPETVLPTPQEVAPLEEEKINRFADAYLAVEEVHSKTAAALKTTTDPVAATQVRANGETRMIQAIERSGLQLQEFNQRARTHLSTPVVQISSAVVVLSRNERRALPGIRAPAASHDA